ncbi:hypothetical protein PIB30_041298 [Stylosanthes scabra]|uniref:Uncharacterized protein n=1 Tax=Stylosanthes scabra TaxID=79078 RepID=A0ABU6ZDK2_9FABA|nr:hypothetical protein [Stylosanthes scabra]
MIIFHIVEYHQPDRVMRQFGLDQSIPARPHQPDHLHSVTLFGKTEDIWLVTHRDILRRITRKWIGQSSATLGHVVDLVEQLQLSSDAPPPGFTLDSVHHATTKILAALGEHDRAIHHQFS